jgi:uncharacterized membrane protein
LTHDFVTIGLKSPTRDKFRQIARYTGQSIWEVAEMAANSLATALHLPTPDAPHHPNTPSEASSETSSEASSEVLKQEPAQGGATLAHQSRIDALWQEAHARAGAQGGSGAEAADIFMALLKGEQL